MRLLPLLLITLNSFAQKDSIYNYVTRLTCTDWIVKGGGTNGADTAFIECDTISSEGSYLKIQIRFADSIIVIQGGDTLHICDWEIKRGDYSVVRLWLQKETGGEPMPVQGLLLKDFFDLTYPEIIGKRKSVTFTLVSAVKSVSN